MIPLLFFISTLLYSGPGHDHTNPTPKPPSVNPSSGGGSGSNSKINEKFNVTLPEDEGYDDDVPPDAPVARGCAGLVGPLNSFARGESYNYGAMVSYLTSSDCATSYRDVGIEAAKKGVNFSTRPDFRLDNLASGLLSGDAPSAQRSEDSLLAALPNFLRNSNLSTKELLPLVGQTALISRKGGRQALAYLIERELDWTAESMLRDSEGKNALAISLAERLEKLGLTENEIGKAVAARIQDKVEEQLTEALKRMLIGLEAAAKQKPTLVPALELAGNAVQEASGNTASGLTQDGMKRLLETLLVVLTVSLEEREVSALFMSDLNDAIEKIGQGKKLPTGTLNKIWEKALAILGKTNSQTALAKWVSFGITPELLYLDNKRVALLSAANNYSEIAAKIQQHALKQAVAPKLIDRKRKTASSAKDLATLWAPSFIELNPENWNPFLFKKYGEEGQFSNEQIESFYPKKVLMLTQKLGWNSNGNPPNLQEMANQVAESFTLGWELTQVYIPVVNNWVAEFEKNETE